MLEDMRRYRLLFLKLCSNLEVERCTVTSENRELMDHFNSVMQQCRAQMHHGRGSLTFKCIIKYIDKFYPKSMRFYLAALTPPSETSGRKSGN